VGWLDELIQVPLEQLLDDRHRKFRRIASSTASLETSLNPAQTGHERDSLNHSPRQAGQVSPRFIQEVEPES